MKKIVLITTACLALSACGTWFGDDESAPLAGERQPVLAQRAAALPTIPESAADYTTTEMVSTVAETQLEPEWNNAFWPQAGGYANHAMQHVAVTYPLKKLWSRSIGKGSTRELPLVAQPVMAEGKIVSLDSKGTVRAFDASTGKQLWSQTARIQEEDDTVIGGGIGLADGFVFVTAGYNEVLSLSAQTGDVQWRQKLSAPARSAPSIADGRVFVVTLDNRTTALSATTGTQLWQHQGLEESAGLLGMAAPAISRNIVMTAYSSGEIYALRVENGSSTWSDNLSALQRRGSRSSLSDIRALPVVDKGIVFVVSAGGRTAAIDENTGERLWDIGIGGTQTPFVSGNRIFLIDLNQRVVALDRTTGRIVWDTQLQAFEDIDDKEDPISWNGPILAGGQLLAFSSEGDSVTLSPETGVIGDGFNANTATTIPPIVAGGTLYLLSTSGTLTAWQ